MIGIVAGRKLGSKRNHKEVMRRVLQDCKLEERAEAAVEFRTALFTSGGALELEWEVSEHRYIAESVAQARQD